MKMSKVSKTRNVRRSKYQIFPPLLSDRHQALEKSVVAHGVETATTWDSEGNLLDGWERERICVTHGLRCPREVRQFETEAEKYRFVLEVNAHRRPSLSQKQKREVIGSYLMGDAEIADNMLAQTLGVSKNTVLAVRRRLEATHQIRKVTKSRGKDGKLRPVRYAKRIITNTAKEFEKAQEIIVDLPDNCAGKMLDVITASRRATRNKKKEECQNQIITSLADDDIRLYHCRFQDLEQVAGLQPASTRLFLTDVPYEQAFLPQIDDLAQLAKRALIEGGLLLLYVGQGYLNRVMASLDEHLTYRWTAAFVWGGDANMFYPLMAASQWKPILVYSKGSWQRRARWSDVIRGTGKEKEWHEWQQPLDELERLVSYFSQPGDLVVDPCGGGFTTAEACLRLSRRCISCDVRSECVSRGWDRLEAGRKRLTVGA